MSSSLNLCNNKPFLNWLWCGTKNGFYINNQRWPGLCLDQEEAPKHFPKSNLHPKRVIVTVWWSAAQLVHYSFPNPGEAITSERSMFSKMDEMHRKLQHLQPALANRKGPILLHDNAQQHVTQPTFNSWTHRAMKFCLICHIHLTSCQLTTTSSSIWTTFCRENASSRKQKILSKSSSNPEAWIFTL